MARKKSRSLLPADSRPICWPSQAEGSARAGAEPAEQQLGWRGHGAITRAETLMLQPSWRELLALHIGDDADRVPRACRPHPRPAWRESPCRPGRRRIPACSATASASAPCPDRLWRRGSGCIALPRCPARHRYCADPTSIASVNTGGGAAAAPPRAPTGQGCGRRRTPRPTDADQSQGDRSAQPTGRTSCSYSHASTAPVRRGRPALLSGSRCESPQFGSWTSACSSIPGRDCSAYSAGTIL